MLDLWLLGTEKERNIYTAHSEGYTEPKTLLPLCPTFKMKCENTVTVWNMSVNLSDNFGIK
jgi:hypothetical protein